ncbi:hypothetical protein G3I01_14595 [Gramella sp. MT6]|uniref:HYC_CC_PP family protein n=1 Tax=Gramella sp. MT6 TaxID=2705471 RepID=UPI001C5F07CE|nr:hypothetical protein [Gramella sp. MT6]QYA26674.1 hypothetical protein G3I01_14595 [Gramella sp. MT6]
MKNSFRNIISLSLALLVVFSTLSFTVEKHFCGKTLVGKAVFSSAKKCSSEMHICAAEDRGHMNTKKDSCCSNKKENIDGQDELKTSSFSFDFLQFNYIIPLIFISENFLYELPFQEIPHKYYKPPLLFADVQVFYQVFLI